jgi:mandelate racemase
VTLTLRELRVQAVDVPMARPLQTAVGVIPSTPLALIDLVSEEGVTGTTYVFCYSRPGLAAVVAALRELGPALAGTELAPVPLWTQLRARFRLLGTSGAIGLALNGIDMAAWDAAARAASLPLVELLGGRAGGTVTAYGSLKSMRPEDLAEEAAERVAEGGFRYLKLKIGAGDLNADLAAIAAVRDAAGAGAGLMVDYNQSLTLTEALARIRVLDDQGLTWIEEPLPAEDLDGYARLCAAVETPIQAGESWWSPEEAARSVAARASDLVMPDVARVGGVTGWLRAAAVAGAAGLRISTHVYPEVSAHLLAATPGAHLLEDLDKTRPLLDPALVYTDGELTLPSTPGSGVAFDPDAVERFSV